MRVLKISAVYNIMITIYLGSLAISGAAFGEGEGNIWLHDVNCTGNERALMNCAAVTGRGSCTHSQDAGIRCQPGKSVIQSW